MEKNDGNRRREGRRPREILPLADGPGDGRTVHAKSLLARRLGGSLRAWAARDDRGGRLLGHRVARSGYPGTAAIGSGSGAARGEGSKIKIRITTWPMRSKAKST